MPPTSRKNSRANSIAIFASWRRASSAFTKPSPKSIPRFKAPSLAPKNAFATRLKNCAKKPAPRSTATTSWSSNTPTSWRISCIPQKGLQSRDLCFLPFLARWGTGGLHELRKASQSQKARPPLHRPHSVTWTKTPNSDHVVAGLVPCLCPSAGFTRALLGFYSVWPQHRCAPSLAVVAPCLQAGSLGFHVLDKTKTCHSEASPRSEEPAFSSGAPSQPDSDLS